MKFTPITLVAAVAISLSMSMRGAEGGCPFSGRPEMEMPQDGNHQQQQQSQLRRRRLQSLHEDESTRAKLDAVIANRAEQTNNGERSLQEGVTCLSEATYDAIDTDISNMLVSITDPVDRAHFLGGIVRLAAHDFMDYDINAASNGQPTLGPDGCLDFSHAANAGLPDLWCPTCLLTTHYETNYASILSKADFWIIMANAVIRQTSPNNALDLKSTFRWGRDDHVGACLESSDRLPEANHCSEVEGTFLTRMAVTWEDAVALMGAHTLGRGDATFSGHHGIWVDTDAQSQIFDKRYYEELLRRAWRPRNVGQTNQDWTWARDNGGSPRFMLNTDLCLAFDIDNVLTTNPDGCCTRTDRLAADGISNACVDPAIFNVSCPSIADTVGHPRQAALDAVNLFVGGNNINNDNQVPFFNGFTVAWEKATMLGWENANLQVLRPTCDPTPQPTAGPTESPSATPTSSPTASPTDVPTSSPTTASPTPECHDNPNGIIDNNNRQRDCDGWVNDPTRPSRCRDWAHECPAACNECDCLLVNRVCTSNSDCCSGICGTDGRCGCKARRDACTHSAECCSGFCHGDGECRVP